MLFFYTFEEKYLMKINKPIFLIIIFILTILMSECTPSRTGYRKPRRKKCDCPTFSIKQTHDSETRTI